ncbi:kinase-like domain-containing protein [Cerioporus squamosus]|nr:kinase-like domain-containing protein [Cerioporus squamosus]
MSPEQCDETARSSTSLRSGETQPASSPSPSVTVDPALWGSLVPLGLHLGDHHPTRIDFWRTQRRYVLGRGTRDIGNDFSFPNNLRLGEVHCAIEWDGCESSTSAVTITDLSHGSTWVSLASLVIPLSSASYRPQINGERVLGGATRIIRNYNIINLGSNNPSTQALSFMFRHYHLEANPEDDVPQQLRQDYDIQLSLGRGAYATVVKALHVHEKRWYAIKVLSRHAMDTVRGRLGGGRGGGATEEHLKKEIDVLSRLRYRYIVQFKEAAYGDRSVGIVMEFVPGGDLGAYMKERRVLQESQAKHFTYQICRALAYLHGNGVVHRDLKPENVLLTNDEPKLVKLADFGFAKVVHATTCLRTQCGTPLYMAPEVSDQNVEGYSEAVDSWSLGVMVCVMLWGRNPFVDGSKEVDYHLAREFGTSALDAYVTGYSSTPPLASVQEETYSPSNSGARRADTDNSTPWVTHTERSSCRCDWNLALPPQPS